VTRTFGNQESRVPFAPTIAACRLSVALLIHVLTAIHFLFPAYPVAAQTNATASASQPAPQQHFACNVGYTQRECQIAMTVLKKTLEPYPVEALGEWTWVLVRTEDWKQILADRRLDTKHPAFSYLPKRATFLDGALLLRSSIRGAQLSAIWHLPIEDLLDLAIRHEIAHALCNDPDETKAERAAIELKNGTALSCGVIQRASTANPK